MSVGIQGGNVRNLWVAQATLSPVSVAANTTAEQTFTFVGLRTFHNVNVNKPSAQAGLGIVNARVSANDTLAITFSNNTGAPIVPTAAEIYNILVASPESGTPTTKLSF